MKVLAHLDPIALEGGLLDRIAESRRGDPLRPVLVLVPTVRLAHHVQRRLAEEFGACLAVDVLHHGALVRRILDDGPGIAVRPASPRVLAALLEKVLAGLPDNPWAVFARERPGALTGILGAITDLREAGLSAGEVRSAIGGGPDDALARIFSAYVSALEERDARGLTDRAGMVTAALAGAAEHARRYHAVFHHGAYELIGVHLELLRAVERGAPVTFLAPVEPGARVSAYAERFARRYLVGDDDDLERLPERDDVGPLGERLRLLYDEPARPGTLAPGLVRLRHSQGARHEVDAAVHAALGAVGRGATASRIALIARSLEPYAAALEDALDAAFGGTGEGAAGALHWTSSLAAPLRRAPVVRDLLLFLRVLVEGFPRAATAELLQSPRIRWRAVGLPAAPRAETVETWSRKAGIVGGVEEWCRDLPRWASEPRLSDDATEEERAAEVERARDRTECAERIADAVQSLVRCLPTSSRRWIGHANALEALTRDVLQAREDDGGAAALFQLLDEMRDLERLVGDARRVPFREMAEWLERAVDTARLPVRLEDRGGLRVLDAMQARGLTFDRVVWIGFQSGLFPRPSREDPFLTDMARRKLRGVRPLPVKSEGEDEERLLLALMLGAAGEAVEVSWQRSDEAGRPRNPSLALRELARLVIGRPDAAALAGDSAGRLRSHPKDVLEDLERDSGLLSPAEELLLLALRSAGDPAAEEALLAREPGLAWGLEMMRSTESISPRDLRFDGRVGAERSAAAADLSVSGFEQLGRCPLQFFFRRRLGVRALDDEAGPFEIASREMGQRVHRILERIYRTLGKERQFDAAQAEVLEKRALGLLADVWRSEMEDLGERFRRRTPILWSAEEARWRAALQSFLRRDLARMAQEGWTPQGLEEWKEEPLPLGPGINLTLRGRFDRVLSCGEGTVIGDYKTSGNLKRRGSPVEMLRGQALQVPLYRLLSGGSARVELLGVGPDYHGDGSWAGEADRVVVFEGFGDEEVESGFRETLRVLASCRDEGRFPLISHPRRCGWCDYRRACRRNHPPTIHREETSSDAADLRDLAGKSTRGGLVLLDRVREQAR